MIQSCHAVKSVGHAPTASAISYRRLNPLVLSRRKQKRGHQKEWVHMQASRAAEHEQPCYAKKIRTIEPIEKVHYACIYLFRFSAADSYSAPYFLDAMKGREKERLDASYTPLMWPRN
jgi:hypothetical protein